MQRSFTFTLMSAGAALVVGVLGGMIAGPEGRSAVWMGAGVALAIQLLLFYTFFVLVFGGKPLLAHGLGMLGRLMAVGTIALFWVPWANVPAAPLLFSLVAVLFVTTLFEPIVMIGQTHER